MKIRVPYSASSNISYHGTWTFTVDPQDWDDLSEEDRDSFVDELVDQELKNDISCGPYTVHD